MMMATPTIATAADGAGSSGWKIEHTPNPQGAQDSQLASVACPSFTVCIAVGHYDNQAGTSAFTLAEAWDGATWRIVPTPNPEGATFSELWGVACPSLTVCIAVGDTAPRFDTHRRPLAAAWDGRVWTRQAIPAPEGQSDLRGIACASTTSCIAVGGFRNGQGAFSEAWDGTAWTIQRIPNPKRTRSIYLIGVSCSGPSACTAVGNYQQELGQTLTLAERWNGTTWAVQPTLNQGTFGSFLYGVSCTSPTTCIAVGFYLGNSRLCQPPNHCNLTLAEAWDGTAWTLRPMPKPPRHVIAFELTDVACASPTACTAVGDRMVDKSGMRLALSETWDGSTWRLQRMPPRGSQPQFVFLYSITCISATTCTAVGGRGIGTLAERE